MNTSPRLSSQHQPDILLTTFTEDRGSENSIANDHFSTNNASLTEPQTPGSPVPSIPSSAHRSDDDRNVEVANSIPPSDENQQAAEVEDPYVHIRPPGTPLPSRWAQMEAVIKFHFVVVLLFIFVAYYVQQTLTIQNPALGALLFSPSITVAVINAMSTILVTLIAGLYGMVFDAVRWQLAGRRRGVKFITFLSLSGATSLLGVARLLPLFGFHQFSCIQR
jgi:hypothetical protein